MKIVIVGAGKVGVALTRHLAVENRVTVIDQNPHLVENIINIYDVMGVCGNGASYDVQKEADVEQAELLIATTSSEEVNRPVLLGRDSYPHVRCGEEGGCAAHHRRYLQPGIRPPAAVYAQ